ncbi:MAG: hypothetical protein GX575_03615 [Candidatus Anammoximicrobium sp.]|nr:hypothetical protein [Candidatus Anammoximicrobium sp.]
MRSVLLVLAFVAFTMISWGLYGPAVHEGQYQLGGGAYPSSLRPFICVGLAYFLIAVLVPLLTLRSKSEQGNWTVLGAVWAFLAGAVGALGALGMVLAFKFRGDPVYVMPLIFGLAPVVNTFFAMWLARTFKEARPLFFSGVILVAVGAAGVLSFKPATPERSPVGASAQAETTTDPATTPAASAQQASTVEKLVKIPLSIALAALCWGAYGPLLHKGQMRMAGSRLRPFLCVGLAYFVIAVLLPLPLIQFCREPGGFNFSGITWSLAGGAAGAIGALGIVLAFNFGGRPVYVMPLVFGGAPIVNTFTAVLTAGNSSDLSPLFLASLIVLIAGSATVLVFAPRQASPAAEPRLSESLPGEPPTPATSERKPDDETSPGDDCREDLEDTLDDDDTVMQERPD